MLGPSNLTNVIWESEGMDLSITLLTASSHCVVTFVMPLSISSVDIALAGPEDDDVVVVDDEDVLFRLGEEEEEVVVVVVCLA
jgi:hypothetical protein